MSFFQTQCNFHAVIISCIILHGVIHAQVKAHLTDRIVRRANSAAAEARQWIADAHGKVTWCAETDSDVDHSGIEARLSVINDLSNSVSGGELIRDTALRCAQNAVQAAAGSDSSHWINHCQQLNDDWTEFTAKLQHTR